MQSQSGIFFDQSFMHITVAINFDMRQNFCRNPLDINDKFDGVQENRRNAPCYA